VLPKDFCFKIYIIELSFCIVEKSRTEYLSKYTPELKEQMYSLHLKGLNGKQISEELGVNRNTVSSIIRKLKQNENS
tara:strand:+ start:665 stop:895 length:231 start_codon:yes stop_codon:yes gene_type:complete